MPTVFALNVILVIDGMSCLNLQMTKRMQRIEIKIFMRSNFYGCIELTMTMDTDQILNWSGYTHYSFCGIPKSFSLKPIKGMPIFLHLNNTF